MASYFAQGKGNNTDMFKLACRGYVLYIEHKKLAILVKCSNLCFMELWSEAIAGRKPGEKWLSCLARLTSHVATKWPVPIKWLGERKCVHMHIVKMKIFIRRVIEWKKMSLAASVRIPSCWTCSINWTAKLPAHHSTLTVVKSWTSSTHTVPPLTVEWVWVHLQLSWTSTRETNITKLSTNTWLVQCRQHTVCCDEDVTVTILLNPHASDFFNKCTQP